MRYPNTLINRFDDVAAFVEAANEHPAAPARRLTAAAVYMWKKRDTVPYMWRPVVTGMEQVTEAAA